VRHMGRARWAGRAGVGALAALMALAGAGLVGVALLRPSSPPRPPEAAPQGAVSGTPTQVRQPRPAGTSTPGGRGRAGVADLTTGPVLPESAPVRLSIPRLHVASRLVRLGVDDTGAMEVPADPAVAGWYDLGPSPGALGPAVIAGHVTWNQERGVFFRLGTLRGGDRVRVDRRDGRQAVFAVTRVARFGKAAFPTGRVFGGINHAGLRLITCGGEYDHAAHRYLDNVVVFAALVA
jgi:hypothetical protein